MFPVAKTFASVFKARLFMLMLLCAILAVVVTLGFVGAITWTAAHFVTIENPWLDMLFNGSVGVLTGIGGWFMLPALTVLVAGFFQEKAIRQVEDVYYHNSGQREAQHFLPELLHDIRFTLWAICLNILILPFYAFGIGFVMSIVLNSYLLGREFFESAAGYHLGKAKAKELGRQHKKAVYGGGFIITIMTLVPVLNLFVPLLAVVWMVHVYHRLTA